MLLLRDAGVIEAQTLQAIGDVLGVNRSTILCDLQVLDQVEEYQRPMAEQPWTRRELTVAESAAEIGTSPETVRAMIRDGLVKAHKQPERGQGGR